MNQLPSLEHHFLIAMPSQEDSWFEKSVIYIVEDNEHGTMGLVTNFAHTFNIHELLNHFEHSPNKNSVYLDKTVLRGGPVDLERGFILHKPAGHWKSSMILRDGLAMTVSDDFIDALSNNQAPEQFMVCLGFSGWKPGQLAQELQSNAWLTIPYNESLLFETPIKTKWEVALNTLGISPEFLSMEVGHA